MEFVTEFRQRRKPRICLVGLTKDSVQLWNNCIITLNKRRYNKLLHRPIYLFTNYWMTILLAHTKIQCAPAVQEHKRTLLFSKIRKNVRGRNCCIWRISNLNCWNFLSRTSRYGVTLFTLPILKVTTMLPHSYGSEIGTFVHSRERGNERKETRGNRKVWKHTRLSLSCQHGNAGVSFAIKHVKSVTP